MYTLYYNKDCKECEGQSVLTAKLDWLNRVHLSTETPPTGELEQGEIVVISKDGKIYTEGYALRIICLNVPLFYIFGLLLFLPPILKAASKGKAGCNGASCEINS